MKGGRHGDPALQPLARPSVKDRSRRTSGCWKVAPEPTFTQVAFRAGVQEPTFTQVAFRAGVQEPTFTQVAFRAGVQESTVTQVAFRARVQESTFTQVAFWAKRQLASAIWGECIHPPRELFVTKKELRDSRPVRMFAGHPLSQAHHDHTRRPGIYHARFDE